MSHSSARICVEHKVVQLQCRCPEPITTVIEEGCKHGDITDQTLFWNGEKIVRGLDSKRTESILMSMDYKSLLQRYLLHVGELEGTTFLGRHLDNNSDFTDDEREALRALVAS